MSAAYTEQDLRIAHDCMIALGSDFNESGILEEHIASWFARIRSEARAGMREACAKKADEAANFYEGARGQHNLKPDWNDARLKGARNEAECIAREIRSLPDLAADEAIERIKREARLSLTADLAAMVNYRYLLRDVTERLLKYAENVYPRCPEDSERELEEAKERRSLIADAKTILYETGIAALSGKETKHENYRSK